MARHNIHHVPVLDGQRVVGMVTATDLTEQHSSSAVYLAGDIYKQGISKEKVGTAAFADAVIARLGQKPTQFKPVQYAPAEAIKTSYTPKLIRTKSLVGTDMFVDWAPESGRDGNELANQLKALEGDGLQLIMITNRGQKVWPDARSATYMTDHWRCRFQSISEMEISHDQIINLLMRAADAGFDVVKTENLYMFDGERGYSLGAGE